MSTYATAIINKALDGLSMRAEYTAQNIANAQTAGYAPVTVRFEEALAKAARRHESISGVRPLAEPTLAAPGASNSVRLDSEVAIAAATANRYAALVEILNRQFEAQSLAISGGR